MYTLSEATVKRGEIHAVTRKYQTGKAWPLVECARKEVDA